MVGSAMRRVAAVKMQRGELSRPQGSRVASQGIGDRAGGQRQRRRGRQGVDIGSSRSWTSAAEGR